MNTFHQCHFAGNSIGREGKGSVGRACFQRPGGQRDRDMCWTWKTDIYHGVHGDSGGGNSKMVCRSWADSDQPTSMT